MAKTYYFVTQGIATEHGTKRPILSVEKNEGYEDFNTADAIAKALNKRASGSTEYCVATFRFKKIA